ncbi:MAG: sugar ABC transporter permease [Erysipelotrichia bacterium]|jgi:putative multiple sugar transport system permease protein|nr:sugar ABC transporter permease [Erysipelotrichia bacterium]
MKNFLTELWGQLKHNVRDYGMFIALAVIMFIFSYLSNGLFLSPRNISNLFNQTGYIAVLAVGMTLVIIIRHIDLSVGFVAGFIGAVAAILMVQNNVNVYLAIMIVLIIGALIGLWNGFLIAKLNLPAFVATLAGMLIFRGALLQVTSATGTIIIPNRFFNMISNGFIPDIVEGRLHVLTLVVGLLGIGFYIFNEFKTRQSKIKYRFEVVSLPLFISKLAFVSAMIGWIIWILANFNGISYTVIIVGVVVLIYHTIMTKTVLGRHIYAVGGNPDAAALSGINVNKITMIVFSSMGFLAALSGIMFASRLQSATVTAGTLFELDAIAAAFVGGVSAKGGIGRVTGSIIGAIVMASLSSGMNLIGLDISLQYIVRGLVLVVAVVFDVKTRNMK